MKYWRAWEEFWFAPKDLFNVGLFRSVFGGTLFIMYLIRFFDFADFYGEQGMLPVAKASMILPEFLQGAVSFYFSDPTYSFAAYILFLVLLFLLTVGVVGRELTWLVWVLHFGFIQRNFAIVYGADLYANFWLLYLCFVRHNRYFSLLDQRRRPINSDLFSTIGIRLIQVQLCISYAYTGVEKLKGTQWWEGTAVWHVLGMQELMTADLSFLQNFPLIISALTMMTLVFEIYFPAIVWSERLRRYWLFIGLCFHIGTALFLSLPFFCMIMISTYVLFIHPKVVRDVWSMFASYLKIPSVASSAN